MLLWNINVDNSLTKCPLFPKPLMDHLSHAQYISCIWYNSHNFPFYALSLTISYIQFQLSFIHIYTQYYNKPLYVDTHYHYIQITHKIFQLIELILTFPFLYPFNSHIIFNIFILSNLSPYTLMFISYLIRLPHTYKRITFLKHCYQHYISIQYRSYTLYNISSYVII